MLFTVVLEVLLRGAACGSTLDVIEATCSQEAERDAIAAWRVARPDRTFAPLLTIAHR